MKSSRLINFWTVAGAIAVALLLGLATLLGVMYLVPQEQITPSRAIVTLIPASTPTSQATAEATQSSLYIPTATPLSGGIAVDGYVQITGTEGLGLRIRATPGLNGQFLFLSFDSEVFKVIDGPESADGLTWWKLLAPYDASRTGWAAADYLALVPAP
jgi:hypothetical protein